MSGTHVALLGECMHVYVRDRGIAEFFCETASIVYVLIIKCTVLVCVQVT